MTGQVKEEVLSRFGELGIRVSEGQIQIQPSLLRAREFNPGAHTFRFIDIGGQWQSIDLPPNSLAFTWCQLPIVFVLDDAAEAGLVITREDDTETHYADLQIPPADSAELFRRSGKILRITVTFGADRLLGE